MMEFYEFAAFQQGKFNARFGSIDNEFFIHDGIIMVCRRQEPFDHVPGSVWASK